MGVDVIGSGGRFLVWHLALGHWDTLGGGRPEGVRADGRLDITAGCWLRLADAAIFFFGLLLL